MSKLPRATSIERRVKDRLKGGLHWLFVQGQSLGVDILPRHFYSSIPDIRRLRNNTGWRKPRSMIGITGVDVDGQLRFAEACCPEQLRRQQRSRDIYAEACAANGDTGYGPVEADFLFCFVASKRPARIVQVGAGVSTAVMLLAAKAAGYRPRLTCIDPFPTEYLVGLDRTGEIGLLRERAQDVELATMLDLGAGDLLFVDSTHTVGPDSEVNRIILEVLPRLSAGCFVHFHDIHFPYEYPPDLLLGLFFPVESPLLHSFLSCNPCYEIAVSLSMLHHHRPDALERLIPRYEPATLIGGLRDSGPLLGHYPTAAYLHVRGSGP